MDKHTQMLISSNEHLRPALLTMRALAHPLRLKIIQMIHQNGGTANVGEIYTKLNIEQSIASQHLRLLRQTQLVTTRRDQKFIYYSLAYGRIAKACRMAQQLAIELPNLAPLEG